MSWKLLDDFRQRFAKVRTVMPPPLVQRPGGPEPLVAGKPANPTSPSLRKTAYPIPSLRFDCRHQYPQRLPRKEDHAFTLPFGPSPRR